MTKFKMNLQFFAEDPNTVVNEPDDAVIDEIQDEPTDIDPVDEPDDSDIEDVVEPDNDDLPELPKEQQNAFQKRLEREQIKLREKLEKELESKYSRHKSIVDQLGGDPDLIEKQLRETQLRNSINQQAQSLAYQYGWDEDQTNQYVQQQVQQQNMQRELQELRIESQINQLRDNPDYAGITGMKKEIAGMVDKSNGVLTVEQAYWALGGKSRAEQLKREAEQRVIAKRSQAKRTVQSDSGTSSTPTSSFSADELAAMKQLGMTAEQYKELMSTPSSLYEFRKQKKK